MGQPEMEEPANEAKPSAISKWEVIKAYKWVRANQGAAGVDEQSRIRCRPAATFRCRCGQ
jgi:hypothetical protein